MSNVVLDSIRACRERRCRGEDYRGEPPAHAHNEPPDAGNQNRVLQLGQTGVEMQHLGVSNRMFYGLNE